MYRGDATTLSGAGKLPRWDRAEAAATLAAYEERAAEISQRQFARERGVARTTLQHWKARKEGLDADPVVVEFLESPQGLAFVHRLVAAVHFVFCQVGPCGVRLVSLFLLLSRLDRVVAASRGSQHAVAVAMEQLIGEFGRSERGRLGATMEPRSICVCEDETFHHGRMCLVGIEPLSNFLLLEQYSERRDEQSWTAAMGTGLTGLEVEPVQAVSDEAKGLLAHAREGLGVEHGPDLFHVQQDLGKATSVALSSRIKHAAEGLEQAREELRGREAERDAYWSGSRGPGRPPAFAQRIAEAQAAERQAEQTLHDAERLRSEVKTARQAISELYHPFDPATGASRTPEELDAGLKEQFDRIEQAAANAGLSQASRQLIAKARRLVPAMVATMAFFCGRMRLALGSLALEPQLERLVCHHLVPAYYLQRIAEQAPNAARRAALRERAASLLAEATDTAGPLQLLPEEHRRLIDQTARRCAEMFVRSSSCVEGRNGQLALRHHCLHCLSDRKLTVLTTIHNYFLTRPDGTTAAERFFGSKPQDLFAWILDRLDLPARPAKKRPRKPPNPL